MGKSNVGAIKKMEKIIKEKVAKEVSKIAKDLLEELEVLNVSKDTNLLVIHKVAYAELKNKWCSK